MMGPLRSIEPFSIEVESGELKEEGAAISNHYALICPTYSVIPSYPYLPDHFIQHSSSCCS